MLDGKFVVNERHLFSIKLGVTKLLIDTSRDNFVTVPTFSKGCNVTNSWVINMILFKRGEEK